MRRGAFLVAATALIGVFCAPASSAPASGAPAGGAPAGGAPAGGAMDESRIVVGLSGGLGPWSGVRYEAFERGGVAVVVHARTIAGRSDEILHTALVTEDEYRALWRALLDADAFALPEAVRPSLPGEPTATIELVLGDRRVRRSVPGPHSQPDPRFAAVVDAVADLARARAGPVPFRDIFYPPDTLGWLEVSSAPSADVTIDGRPTGDQTPIERFDLPAGAHRITLRNARRGIERTYDFRVEAGMTTVLDLDLR